MPRESKPWFRAASNTWVSRVNGRLYTLARGKGSRTEANKRLREITSQATRPVERDMPRIETVLESFLAGVQNDLRPNTFIRYCYHLLSFVAHVGGHRLASGVRAVDVLRWADGKRWNQSTRAHGLAVVSRMFSWGASVGLLESNPLGRIPRPAVLRREQCPTHEEILCLLAHLRGGVKELCECMVETGARPSELARAKVSDVQGSRIVLAFHKTVKKTGKPRVIYLSDKALSIVTRCCEGKPPGALIFTTAIGTPWRDKWISEKVATARAAAKLGSHVVPYSIRHWFITEKLHQGVPVAVVAALVGTSIKQIDSFYGHVGENDELRRWVG